MNTLISLNIIAFALVNAGAVLFGEMLFAPVRVSTLLACVSCLLSAFTVFYLTASG